MQVHKINSFPNINSSSFPAVPTFTRKLREDEKEDYNKNAIQAALDYLGVQSVAMILHGSCNPVIGNDLGIGSPCNEKTKDVIKLEKLHGFNANQLGPMGEVTRGDISPYSASVFALNKMFIDAEALTKDEYANILSEEELKTFRVNYHDSRTPYTYSKFFDSFENYDRIIKDAYFNFVDKVREKDPAALKLKKEYEAFRDKKGEKLTLAAVFEVLSKTYGTRDTDVWESEIDRNLPALIKDNNQEALNRFRQIMQRSGDDIHSFVFGQFLVNKQLKENQDFRKSMGFEYINDNLVGNDRSEEWIFSDVFLKNYRLGCPEGGKNNGPQLWDIPVVNPKKLFNRDGSLGPAGKFLKEKLEAGLEYCENIRIDHALGLVDPYVYDKRSVAIIDGNLDWGRFRGANISNFSELDPEGNYKKILERIVLPTLKEHKIKPEKAVWEDLGNQTWTFHNIYKEQLHLPGMTQLHWERGEGKPRENWALMGSHDEASAMDLLKNTNLKYGWDNDNSAWHIDYLSGFLNQDPARAAEKETFKRNLWNDPTRRIKSKFAELFLIADRVQIPFTDFFGIEQRYNEKGTKSANNWKLRLNKNFENDYYKNLSSENPTALNMAEILKIAVQARMDMDVVKYSHEQARMSDGSFDERKISEFRHDLYKEKKPLLKKLDQYEKILKEKE